MNLKEECTSRLYAVDRSNSNYQRLLNSLFEKPYVMRNDVVEKLGVSSPTAGSILDVFCETGILVDLTPGKSRYKLYRFEEYLSILNKGTELV